jgi:hypothetical protein
VLRFPLPQRAPDDGVTHEVGERSRDLRERATGDIGGDETQVIRLDEKSVDAERTQVIRPQLVTPPGERTEVLKFRPTSIADAERPDFADDPTSRIVPPELREDTGDERPKTVLDMEQPPDEAAGIPAPRRPADDEI